MYHKLAQKLVQLGYAHPELKDDLRPVLDVVTASRPLDTKEVLRRVYEETRIRGEVVSDDQIDFPLGSNNASLGITFHPNGSAILMDVYGPYDEADTDLMVPEHLSDSHYGLTSRQVALAEKIIRVLEDLGFSY